MDRIRIRGGRQLKGEIRISGSKNASLPLMVAALLTDQKLTLHNVPRLADITHHDPAPEAAWRGDRRGARRERPRPRHDAHPAGGQDLLDHGALRHRAQDARLGAGAGRPAGARGRARVSLPGGCAIGARPVDLHIAGLQGDGRARSTSTAATWWPRRPRASKGARFTFPKVSVGATENLMMAAALAKGTTVLDNAAREPEITDLAAVPGGMGVPVAGIGTETLTIEGVKSLQGGHAQRHSRPHRDRHLRHGGGDDGGRCRACGRPARPDRDGGAEPARGRRQRSRRRRRGLRVQRTNGALHGVDVMTEPYPGFPTDLQAQMMALMTRAEGASMITETMFESRFMHVPELSRMGANVTIHHDSALVRGVPKLRGAEVMATDLRASVSLAIAALAAEGDTVDEPRLSPRPRLRAAGGEARRLRRRYRAAEGLIPMDDKLKLIGARRRRSRRHLGGRAGRAWWRCATAPTSRTRSASFCF